MEKEFNKGVWVNPPIENKAGQQYLRLYSAVSSTQYPTQKELDEIVKIVKEDFFTPSQPIDLAVTITANGVFCCTNTIEDNNIIK